MERCFRRVRKGWIFTSALPLRETLEIERIGAGEESWLFTGTLPLDTPLMLSGVYCTKGGDVTFPDSCCRIGSIIWLSRMGISKPDSSSSGNATGSTLDIGYKGAVTPGSLLR